MGSAAPSTRAYHRPVLRAGKNIIILPVNHTTTATATAHIRSTTPATAHHQQIHLRDVRRHGEVAVSDIREDHTKHIQIHAGVGQTGSGEGQRSRRIGEDRGSGNSGEDRGANYAGAGREGQRRCVRPSGGGRNLIPRRSKDSNVTQKIVRSDINGLRIRSCSGQMIESVRRQSGRDARRIVHHHHARSTPPARTLITCTATTPARVGRSSGGRKAVVPPASITAATPPAVDIVSSIVVDRSTATTREPTSVP